jgi:hypothetical protein
MTMMSATRRAGDFRGMSGVTVRLMSHGELRQLVWVRLTLDLPSCDRLRAPSVRTGVRLPVETFVLVRERRFCGISSPGDRDDINAVKVIALPFRHNGRIAAVSGEEFLGYSFDKPVLPGNQDKRIAVDRLLDSGLQPIGIGEAEARIDRQTEEYRSRLDRREGSDVIV